MIAALLAITIAAVTPSPSPSPTPSTIVTVRVATASAETLHALPVAASALGEVAIARSSALTADDLLRLLPGVDRTRSNSQFTNYGQLRVSFAGAGTDRGLVLVDGVPAGDGFGGQIDWAAYPVEELSRVELLRGAGSALYGPGAVGGVLSMSTYRPRNLTSPVLFSAQAGSNDFGRAFARAATSLGSRADASFAVSSQYMSYADLPPGYTSPIDSPASSRSSTASLAFSYDASHYVSLRYDYRGAWDYQQEGRPNYDMWRRSYQHAIGVNGATARGATDLTFFTRDGRITNRSDQFPATPGVLRYTQDIPTSESGMSAGWTVASDRSIFAMRADGRFIHGATTQYGPANAVQSAVAGSQTLAGLALEQTWRGPRFEFVAGARGDLESVATGRQDRAVSPRAALRYDLTKNLAVRVSDGAGFRVPYLNELIRSYQIGTVRYLSNPNLVPERSSSLSAGIDWAHGPSRLAIDLMHTVVNNALGFATIDATHQQRTNFGQARTDGQTATYTYDASCTHLTLSETTQYARLTQGPAASLGKRLQYVPQASASATLDRNVGALLVGTSLSYAGQTYADDLNTQPLGTALIAGAHVGIPLRGFELRIEASNLTNARYLSSIDRFAPPATVSIGLLVPSGAPASDLPRCSAR